jgi:Tfp pilus assembly pilus retraction ATPase PilT
MPKAGLVWARSRIRSLDASDREDEALVVAKEFNLLSSDAAFIAWDEAEQVPVAQSEIIQPALEVEEHVSACMAPPPERLYNVVQEDGLARRRSMRSASPRPRRMKKDYRSAGLIGGLLLLPLAIVRTLLERAQSPSEPPLRPEVAQLLERLCQLDQGMVLLAGVTGSGKSTTIASMLNWINRNYRKHILTLEDPIEFVYVEDKCLINQREVGADVKDFSIAMKHAVREDPDIILVGEMRDEETFMTAIHAAETGHLVFGTIHASSAPSTIGRILDLFPEELHKAIRNAIAFNMKGIVAQKLLRSIRQGVSRVPTCEIMTFTPMIRKLLLEEKDQKLSDAIRIGAAEGMQDFTMSLKQLIDDGLIDRPTAFEVAPNPEALKMALKGINVSQPGII